MTKDTATAAELAARYNELTGKSVKPTSYTKAKFRELIEAAELPTLDLTAEFQEMADEADAEYDAAAEADAEAARRCNSFHGTGTAEDPRCPHCDIDHVSNGYSIHDPKDSPHDKYEIACLGCGGEWGDPITTNNSDTFTLKEICAAAGVKPRTARKHLRAYLEDGEYTRYIWERTQEKWEEIEKVITNTKG